MTTTWVTKTAGRSSGTSTKRPRAVKSTVVLGRHPPNKPDAELFLIVYKQSKQTGERYKITANVKGIFTKFLHEGKTTISLHKPEHDLLIQGDAAELKSFMHAMHIFLDDKSLQIPAMQTLTAFPKSTVKKMKILDRSRYPGRALPPTLKSLTVCFLFFCLF